MSTKNDFMMPTVILLSFILLTACGQSKDGHQDSGKNNRGSEGIVAGNIKTWIDVKQKNSVVHFAFHLKNQTEQGKTYHFNTAQRFDFVIKDESGNVVKQFSEGKLFMQVLGELTLKQGETVTYEEKVELPPGKYTIEWWLTANEEQPRASSAFTIN